MLNKQLQEQIEQDAKSSAANFNYYPGSSENEDLESAYITGATKYAEKLQTAEQWKKEAKLLLDPLIEWGQAQKDMPLGVSITEEILRRAKLWQAAEERAQRYEKALKEIQSWELTTNPMIKVKHVDILKDIMKTVNNALNSKTSTDERRL